MKLTGLPTIYDIDPLSSSTTQNLALGAIGYDKIGRKYRYAKAGGVALVGGQLQQMPARDVQFTEMAVSVAAAIGANQISFTNGTTTIAAGDFVDGTATITSGTGLGQTFAVKAHGTGGSGATIVLTIQETVLVALTTSSKLTLSANPYYNVVVSVGSATKTGTTVGVALCAVAIGSYCWLGVEGRFGILSDASVAAVGDGISSSAGTAGAVTKAITLLERIGTAPILGVSAKYMPVDLRIP